MAYADEKTHGSAKYHGMKVGGMHDWTYPGGQWKERKVAPDRWEVGFTSLKRRNRRAPAKSGAEVGSGYHWLVVAHQWVEKLDANTYSTQMEGAKYLIAFKKPDWPVWNTQFRNQRRHAKERTIAALEDAIRRLRESKEDFEEVGDAAALVDLASQFEQEKAEEETRATEVAETATAAESTSPGRARRASRPRRTGGRPKRQRRQTVASR